MSCGAFQDMPPCEATPCQNCSGKEQGGSSLRGEEKPQVQSSPCPSSEDLETKTPGALQGRASLTPLSYPWAGFWSILHQENVFILPELQGRAGAVTQG